MRHVTRDDDDRRLGHAGAYRKLSKPERGDSK